MTLSKKIEIIVILAVLTAFSPLSIDMYLPSMPTLEHFFHADSQRVQITLSTFFIGFALGQAFYGPISDRFGRKKPLYISLSLFVIASVGCANASTLEWLSIFRFFEAIGACAGGVIARAIVRDIFRPEESAGIFSALMIVMGLAPMLAPIIGSAILASYAWKDIFYTLALIGIVCILLVYFRLSETHKSHETYSLRLSHIMHEYTTIAKNRYFIGYVLMGGFAAGGMFAYITASSFVFINGFGLNATNYGMLFGMNAFGLIFASFCNVFLSRRYEPDRIALFGVIGQLCFGTLLFSIAIFSFGGIYGVSIALFLFLFCMGFIGPNAAAMAMAPFKINAGSASALLGTIQFSIGALSSFIVGALKNSALLSMGTVMFCCGVLSLVSYGVFIRGASPIEIAPDGTHVE